MSHSTLDDFYKGMRQPRYDGSNVLNQLKQLSGGATMQQTVTVTQTKTVSGGPQVPPLGAGVGSIDSFNQHVAASLTDGAKSQMFNEQSFGR
mgnify:CR=1 FL=1